MMNVGTPGKILIVGGGSSGWMTAAFLQNSLPDAEITLIEASDIPILGVGESTNLTVRYFHKGLGIDEKSFMKASNGAYKMAIRFANFNRLGSTYFHPFGAPPDPTMGFFSPDAQSHYPAYHLAERGLFSPQIPYSYQVDAGLYGQFLKTLSIPNGVRHIVDRITGATVDESGSIASIKTEKSGDLSADLYVDCSGFRSFLLEKTLGVPFHSINHELLNDRAIAARIPYVSKAAELRSYTNCTALSAGWVWEIPLWSRMGTGYVYSSNFLTPSAAENEFRRFLGEARVQDVEFNHIEIRAGRHEQAWHRNCVAIGVSYGFLEPLESTGLSLTQIAISNLAKVLKNGASSADREWFNKRQAELFDTTKDFILAHYVLTDREDTEYWKHIRHQVKIPDSLAEKLDQAKRGSYEPIATLPNKFYFEINWNVILSGMDYFGLSKSPNNAIELPRSQSHMQALTARIYANEEALPNDGEEWSDIQSGKIEDGSGHPMWYPTW